MPEPRHPLPAPPVAIGSILAEKYRIDQVLGAGAAGIVLGATHLDLEERRAIKFLIAGGTDGVATERLLREARATSRLRSEHVARVYDVGRTETGAPYVVMEYLVGRDLKSLLEERGTLQVSEAVTFVEQLCEALSEAHAAGIIHRDLKPANLFITKGSKGQPCLKVLDFGIAKIIGGDSSDPEMTKTKDLFGTPLYMSPEQMRSTRDVDARSDIWSVGVILYRMLTGATPFVGETVIEICMAVMGETPSDLSEHRRDVPRAVEAIVMRCLEKAPDARFQTTDDLTLALAPFRDLPFKGAPFRDLVESHETAGGAASLSGTAASSPPIAANKSHEVSQPIPAHSTFPVLAAVVAGLAIAGGLGAAGALYAVRAGAKTTPAPDSSARSADSDSVAAHSGAAPSSEPSANDRSPGPASNGSVDASKPDVPASRSSAVAATGHTSATPVARGASSAPAGQTGAATQTSAPADTTTGAKTSPELRNVLSSCWASFEGSQPGQPSLTASVTMSLGAGNSHKIVVTGAGSAKSFRACVVSRADTVTVGSDGVLTASMTLPAGPTQ